MNTFGKVPVSMLTKDNYNTWIIKIRPVKSGVWKYVKSEIKSPENVPGASPDLMSKRDAWIEADERAKEVLIWLISDSELKQIKNCGTSNEIWKKLEQVFESRGPARKATLLKSLILSKMADGGDVSEHCREFFDKVDKLAKSKLKLMKSFYQLCFYIASPVVLIILDVPLNLAMNSQNLKP